MNCISNTIIVTGSSLNSYFYNMEKSSFLICHPAIKYISEMSKKEIEEKMIVRNTKNKEIKIPNFHPITTKTFIYYYKKFEILKSNGYFNKNIHLEEKFSGKFSSIQIIKSLANSNHVSIEVTERCNLKCKYCGYGEMYDGYDANRECDIKLNVIKKLFSELDKYWNSEYNIFSNKIINVSFYGGEPLLGINIIKETIEFLKIKYEKRKFKFSITTNGLLLSKNIKYLVKNDFNILVSLDGNRFANSYRVYNNGNESFNEVIVNGILK
ncbi:MAG: radical SAM protein [Candidatus Delongbacteria bacterium]|nr:radical SAM protein [Candidatus Delongbacteria bacterium]